MAAVGGSSLCCIIEIRAADIERFQKESGYLEWSHNAC